MSDADKFEKWWRHWNTCPRCHMDMDRRTAASNAWYAGTEEMRTVLAAFVRNRAMIKTDEPFQGALDRLMRLAEEALK